jgi:rare lipoprotein A
MSQRLNHLSIVALALALGACSFGGGSSSSGGRFYKSDGPPRSVPSNIDRIPDAVPRVEPFARGPMRPYTVMGQRFTPVTTDRPYRERGMASWYGRMFHGRKTSNGETYDMFAMTAAHTTMPLPSYARVTRVSNGRSVIVRVNDRGPFLNNRIIDLSYAAARRLGMVESGSAEVIVERITHQDIRAGTWRKGGSTTAAAAAAPVVPVAAAAAAPVVTRPATASNEPVFVQIGAFRDEFNARTLATKASQVMPGNVPIEVDTTANRIFRVRLGPFANRDQALNVFNTIEQSLGIRPSISAP